MRGSAIPKGVTPLGHPTPLEPARLPLVASEESVARSGSRKLVAIAAFVFFPALIWVFADSFGHDPRSVPFGLLGKPAPGFALTDLVSGKVVRLEDFRGRPVVLNFWATWCGPCKQEQPVLDAASKAFGDRVALLGVVSNDSAENVARFLREHPESYPQLFDQSGSVGVDYALSGVPETYFIDRRGIIMGKVPMAIDRETLEGAVGELLK